MTTDWGASRRVIRPLLALLLFSGDLQAETQAQVLTDVTSPAGVDFQHQSGAHGDFWLPEIMGSGVGVLDFDSDGLLDLWLIQGGPLLNRTNLNLPRDVLYRNVSQPGEMKFEPVKESLLPELTQYGMGIATADVDRDGDFDVFLANYGRNQLLINEGNGHFTESSEFNTVAGDTWSITGSFGDFNQDGWLDLYVVNYVHFDHGEHEPCLGFSPQPDYCAPTAYEAVGDQLLLNEGGGQFVDVTVEFGINAQRGRGLGAVSADFNGDGRLDIYVANDPKENFLWIQRSSGTMVNQALEYGVAVNGNGKSEASMGVLVADPDHDCDQDLFMTNLTGETNTLFQNTGTSLYLDATNTSGLGSPSFAFTGFGTGWIDFDNDSDLDLFVVNGAVSRIGLQSADGFVSGYVQRNQLWINQGAMQYHELEEIAIFKHADVSRGAAFADLDNDGDIDIIESNNNGPARIYQNNNLNQNHWIGLNLLSEGTSPIHAVVKRVVEACHMQVVRTDGSYASANDPRLLFGLGKETADQYFQVAWPTGETVQYGPLKIDQYHDIEKK